MNYNALFKKKFKNYLFVGLRYAMSSFKYDIATLSVDDPIYGGGIGNPNQVDASGVEAYPSTTKE